MRDGLGRAFLYGYLIGALLTAQPAQAHTADAHDEWMDAWVDRVALEPALTRELAAEYIDFARRHKPIVLPVQRFTGIGTNVEQWRPLVVQYFPTDQVETAMRVMQCESGGNPNAKNPTSSASGLFQHLARFWPERSAAAGWGGSDIFDPEANIAVAAWLQAWGGWGHWVCY